MTRAKTPYLPTYPQAAQRSEKRRKEGVPTGCRALWGGQNRTYLGIHSYLLHRVSPWEQTPYPLLPAIHCASCPLSGRSRNPEWLFSRY